MNRLRINCEAMREVINIDTYAANSYKKFKNENEFPPKKLNNVS